MPSACVVGLCRRRSDGICDDVDDCVGEFDVCGLQWPRSDDECGCTEIIEGDCNCDGNQLDALGGGGLDADVDQMASVTT